MDPRMIVFVFIGGGLGSVSRFLLGLYMWKLFPGFPAGTIVVNLLGTFLIGMVSIVAGEKMLIHPPVRELLQVGFLGGLTTFSTFGLEMVLLYNQSRYMELTLYTLANVVLGVALVVVGRNMARVF